MYYVHIYVIFYIQCANISARGLPHPTQPHAGAAVGAGWWGGVNPLWVHFHIGHRALYMYFSLYIYIWQCPLELVL